MKSLLNGHFLQFLWSIGLWNYMDYQGIGIATWEMGPHFFVISAKIIPKDRY